MPHNSTYQLLIPWPFLLLHPAGEIDILDVFRRPQDLSEHLEDIIKAKPKVVWLQSGITNAEFEQQLAEAGIKVIANRCLKVDHQAAIASSARL
jgi:predicted CoA-binding protein